MTRFRQEEEENGRWSRDIQPVMRNDRPYKMACCDCGLVHDIEFWIEDGRVMMRVARNQRSTGQIRRYLARADAFLKAKKHDKAKDKKAC